MDFEWDRVLESVCREPPDASVAFELNVFHSVGTDLAADESQLNRVAESRDGEAANVAQWQLAFESQIGEHFSNNVNVVEELR